MARQVETERNLAGLEDLLTEPGTTQQSRNGRLVDITGITALNLPFDETRTLAQSITDGFINNRGAWDAAVAYVINDLVTSEGSSYMALDAVVAGTVLTDATKWSLIASKGDTGAAGADGVAGEAGPIGISGTAGPSGQTGDAGADGDDGADGIEFTSRGVWDATVAYVTGDVITYTANDNYYFCTEDNTGNNPTSAPRYWNASAVFQVTSPEAFDNNLFYGTGSIVTYNASRYICIQVTRRGDIPSAGSAYWFKEGA